MSFIRRSTMLAVAALGLVACEETVQKPPVVLSRDVAADLASPEQVHALVGPLIDLLSSPANAFGFGSSVGPAGPAAAVGLAAATEPSADCITSDPKVPVDSDGDEIPLSLTISFNCSDPSIRIAGKVVLKDKDDNDPDSGFSADIDLRIEASDEVSGRSVTGFDFAVDVTELSSSGTALAYDISYAGNFSLETPVAAVKFSYDIDVKHEGTSFAAGVISLDGSFGYSWDADCSKAIGELADECRSQAQSAASKGEVQLTIKAPRLEYDTENCETAITRGTVAMRDSTGNVATIQYTGCDQATATYNGEPL